MPGRLSGNQVSRPLKDPPKSTQHRHLLCPSSRLLMKHIEKARFKWPHHLPLDCVQLNAQQVSWLIDGYDLTLAQGHSLHVNVRAYISLKKGASRPGSLELIEFAQVRIGYKSPEEIVFLDEMPLSPAGKIDRAQLKHQAESLHTIKA